MSVKRVMEPFLSFDETSFKTISEQAQFSRNATSFIVTRAVRTNHKRWSGSQSDRWTSRIRYEARPDRWHII